MATNKETSIGIRLVSDLRNYQKNLSDGQKETRKFKQNVKREVGEVGQSFQALMRGDITALPEFFKSSTAAAGGFAKGLHGVKAALIATGIGALLVGLGLAIAGVIQYFKGTEEGQIVFAKVMNKIKAYTTPVIDVLGKLGKSIVLLFQGKFAEAWDTATGSIAAAGEQIKQNTANLKELNALEESIVKRRRQVKDLEAQSEAEIAELRNKANDEENYNSQQRLGFITKAISLERELGTAKIQLANEEYRLGLLKDEQGDNTIEDTDATLELQREALRVQKETETGLRRLLETQQRIGKEFTKQVDLQATINRQVAERASNTGISTITTRTNFELGTTTPKGELADMGRFMDANTESANRMNEAIAATASEANREGIASLSGSFGQLGSAIGGTTGHFLTMASKISELIPILISQIVALTTAQVASSQSITAAKGSEAIASGTASSQSLPFPFNLIALAATIGSIIAALATKPPKMAAGGLVYGDSLVNVGEYSNARVNPEVIAPLDKLKGMIGGNSSGVEILQPRVDFDGEKLYFSLDRIGKRINKRT